MFEPLDFLAELTQHIPEKGDHQIRYYGWYSNKSRGVREKALKAALAPKPTQTLTRQSRLHIGTQADVGIVDQAGL